MYELQWATEYEPMELLIHRGRGTCMSVNKPTIVGLDNGLSTVRHQAIIFTNAGLLSNRTLLTKFGENNNDVIKWKRTHHDVIIRI